MVVSEGEDFVRKLGAQKMTLYNMGGPAVANLVVSGEVPLVVNNRYSHIYARRKDGGQGGMARDRPLLYRDERRGAPDARQESARRDAVHRFHALGGGAENLHR